MRKLVQVGFVFCFVGVVLLMIQLNRVDREPVPQQKVVECDFYSVDAIYYSPGSVQEAKRKACENKYYGYADGVRKKVFNLGGVDFNIDGEFGFVLHSKKVLSDPKSYRSDADIYIYKSIGKMNGVNVVNRFSGLGSVGIDLKISYVSKAMDGATEPSWGDWDQVGINHKTGIREYIRKGSPGFGSMAYVIKVKDGNYLVLSCKENIGNTPGMCVATRKLMPNYYISYHVNWSAINDWQKFDADVIRFIFSMMGKRYE